MKAWKRTLKNLLIVFQINNMALLGQYKKKIKSSKNIAKLTRAMQLVAASKMKKAQLYAMAGKEYADGVYKLSSLVTHHYDEGTHRLTGKGNIINSGRSLFVLIAPEKGLCGGLITNLSKFIYKEYVGVGKNCDFVVIGKKAKQVAKRFNLNVIADFDLGVSGPKYDMVPPISRIIEERFITNKNYKVRAIYSEFVNTMEQSPVSKVLLPMEVNDDKNSSNGFNEVGDYKFEPDVQSIANPLLEIYLEVEIYQLLLEAYASEQSARMVAMKNATDNANGLIDELTVEYNKVRQSAITNELLDIQNAVVVTS